MIALNFFLTVMLRLPGYLEGSGSAIHRALQPRLVAGHAPFPARDLVPELEREADVVEAFEQPHTIGSRDVERDIGAAGPADALRLQIDRERRGAVHRQNALLESLRVRRGEHD